MDGIGMSRRPFIELGRDTAAVTLATAAVPGATLAQTGGRPVARGRPMPDDLSLPAMPPRS